MEWRSSSCRWASAALANGKFPLMCTLGTPDLTQLSTSPALHSSSSLVAVWSPREGRVKNNDPLCRLAVSTGDFSAVS